MAGWRVGYMAYPDRLAGALAKVQDTVLIWAYGALEKATVAEGIGRLVTGLHKILES